MYMYSVTADIKPIEYFSIIPGDMPNMYNTATRSRVW